MTKEKRDGRRMTETCVRAQERWKSCMGKRTTDSKRRVQRVWQANIARYMKEEKRVRKVPNTVI